MSHDSIAALRRWRETYARYRLVDGWRNRSEGAMISVSAYPWWNPALNNSSYTFVEDVVVRARWVVFSRTFSTDSNNWAWPGLAAELLVGDAANWTYRTSSSINGGSSVANLTGTVVDSASGWGVAEPTGTWYETNTASTTTSSMPTVNSWKPYYSNYMRVEEGPLMQISSAVQWMWSQTFTAEAVVPRECFNMPTPNGLILVVNSIYLAESVPTTFHFRFSQTLEIFPFRYADRVAFRGLGPSPPRTSQFSAPRRLDSEAFTLSDCTMSSGSVPVRQTAAAVDVNLARVGGSATDSTVPVSLYRIAGTSVSTSVPVTLSGAPNVTIANEVTANIAKVGGNSTSTLPVNLSQVNGSSVDSNGLKVDLRRLAGLDLATGIVPVNLTSPVTVDSTTPLKVDLTRVAGSSVTSIPVNLNEVNGSPVDANGIKCDLRRVAGIELATGIVPVSTTTPITIDSSTPVSTDIRRVGGNSVSQSIPVYTTQEVVVDRVNEVVKTELDGKIGPRGLQVTLDHGLVEPDKEIVDVYVRNIVPIPTTVLGGVIASFSPESPPISVNMAGPMVVTNSTRPPITESDGSVSWPLVTRLADGERLPVDASIPPLTSVSVSGVVSIDPECIVNVDITPGPTRTYVHLAE